MEFLRFGSSIPGSYWGCCACCIIQNFNFEPDAPASIQLVGGDGGNPVIDIGGKALFAGPTYRDIFWQRIRYGTFGKRDMPNHAFLAILTENQIKGTIGQKWLAILREAGFEFIRSVSNSVYAGQSLGNLGSGSSKNYLFGLFRNIGTGAIADPFTPPKQWTDLPKVKTEAWDNDGGFDALAKTQHAEDKAIWERIGPPKFLTEEEVVAAGAPVVYAGKRSAYPQQTKELREAAEKAAGVVKQGSLKASPSPVAAAPAAAKSVL